MPASKLKTLLILILSCTCLFLLALLLPQQLDTARRQAEQQSQLETLFAAYDLTLNANSIPVSKMLYQLEMDLNTVSDLEAATALLGQEVLAQDDSTHYISLYQSRLGQCRIARNGTLQAQLTQGPHGTDLVALTRELAEKMGLSVAHISEPARLSAGIYQVSLTQALLDVPNYSTELLFRYENNTLTEITGSVFFGTENVLRVSDFVCLSASDALVRLLSSRNELGWVGQSVLSVQQGYVRTETASATLLRFTPIWLVETDTGFFEINGITGQVAPSNLHSMA